MMEGGDTVREHTDSQAYVHRQPEKQADKQTDRGYKERAYATHYTGLYDLLFHG